MASTLIALVIGRTRRDLRAASGMIARMELREQRCEACGRDFGCGAETGGCWCSDVTVDPVTLAELRAAYDRCLCPACLIARSSGPSTGPARRAT
jgi:hypothetical protein